MTTTRPESRSLARYLAHKDKSALHVQRECLLMKLRATPNHEWEKQREIKFQIDDIEEKLAAFLHLV